MNADTTWLIQLPVPESAGGSRKWFNILLDPWLSGPQADVASWFSTQWHAIPPALSSISHVEELCKKVEELSRGDTGSSTHTASPDTLIDAVAISHEFTDHCHKPTLLECSPSTTVFATTKAAKLVSSWKYFDRVIETPPFSGSQSDWSESTSVEPLPKWVGIGRLVNEKDALYYHSAIIIAFDLSSSTTSTSHSTSSSPTPSECLVYTPHGIHPPSLSPITEAEPPITTLAFLHGLHDVSIDWGQQLNLGAHNGLSAQRMIQARYWIGTHDEVKKGGGLVSWFLRRKVFTVEEALEREAEKMRKEEGVNGAEGAPSDQKGVLGRGEFKDLKNGESAILA